LRRLDLVLRPMYGSRKQVDVVHHAPMQRGAYMRRV
jgi:hypothetical protein